MLTFIGLDLAWSPRNITGRTVFTGDTTGGTLTDVALRHDDAAIVHYVELHAGDGPAIMAVDAPLQVPNTTGQRPAEAALARVFRWHEAGAHPANRRRLAYDGVVCGEQLVAALERRGFIHKPTIAAGDPVRQVIEVFPHPARSGKAAGPGCCRVARETDEGV